MAWGWINTERISIFGWTIPSETTSETAYLPRLFSLHLLWLHQIASRLPARLQLPHIIHRRSFVQINVNVTFTAGILLRWRAAGVRMSPDDKKMTSNWARAHKRDKGRYWWRRFLSEGKAALILMPLGSVSLCTLNNKRFRRGFCSNAREEPFLVNISVKYLTLVRPYGHFCLFQFSFFDHFACVNANRISFGTGVYIIFHPHFL